MDLLGLDGLSNDPPPQQQQPSVNLLDQGNLLSDNFNENDKNYPDNNDDTANLLGL